MTREFKIEYFAEFVALNDKLVDRVIIGVEKIDRKAVYTLSFYKFNKRHGLQLLYRMKIKNNFFDCIKNYEKYVESCRIKNKK